eukprot:CAMPEP_0201566872 /NCGR_PEP_ID=MMETSP0190_2-20130828/6989_1 /ASSEMBLY_ACC=CAM_ASM_000263 /TAXON_ID=37353 /ORGANISM="Rosalina sp." /LENGTH=180 /DNA_ID=CAMNT_0047986161 /DNA_START=991 /DNA_END=1533 /DNA_ORIENTATION=-
MADIFVDRGASIVMDPVQCDPRDPNFVGQSKKDPKYPAKALGVNCPIIRGPGARLEDADLTVEEWEKQADAQWYSTSEYMEMLEAAEIAEQSLDAMIADKVNAFEDNLDLSIVPEFEQDEQLMVVGHTVSSITGSSDNNMLQSNLLTALIVFIMTSVGSLCYIAYKFGGNGETKALLSFE